MMSAVGNFLALVWQAIDKHWGLKLVAIAAVAGSVYFSTHAIRESFNDQMVIARSVTLIGTTVVWGLLAVAIAVLRGTEPERRIHRQRYRLGVYLLFSAFSGFVPVIVGLINLRIGGLIVAPAGTIEALTLAYHLAWFVCLVGLSLVVLGIIGGARRQIELRAGKYQIQPPPVRETDH